MQAVIDGLLCDVAERPKHLAQTRGVAHNAVPHIYFSSHQTAQHNITHVGGGYEV